MVEKRDCSFCGKPIEPGTGKMYVKKDGTRYWFHNSKCQANLLKLKRVARETKWTTHYVKGIAGRSGSQATAGEEKAPATPAATEPTPAAPTPKE